MFRTIPDDQPNLDGNLPELLGGMLADIGEALLRQHNS